MNILDKYKIVISSQLDDDNYIAEVSYTSASSLLFEMKIEPNFCLSIAFLEFEAFMPFEELVELFRICENRLRSQMNMYLSI
jgi:hypothetical protein